MDIINKIFPDLIEFISDNKLDLVFVLKLIDYLFSELDINTEDHEQVSSYIHNVKILNNLYSLFSLTKEYEPNELNAFNNEVVQKLLDDPSRIKKFRAFRVSILEKYDEDLLPTFQEYRAGRF